MKSINGSLTETVYGSIVINEDVHLDGNHSHDENVQPELEDKESGDGSMVQTLAIVIAIVSAIGLGALLSRRIARGAGLEGTILALVCIEEEISAAIHLGTLLRVGVAFRAVREVAVVRRISVEDSPVPTS